MEKDTDIEGKTFYQISVILWQLLPLKFLNYFLYLVLYACKEALYCCSLKKLANNKNCRCSRMGAIFDAHILDLKNKSNSGVILTGKNFNLNKMQFCKPLRSLHGKSNKLSLRIMER